MYDLMISKSRTKKSKSILFFASLLFLFAQPFSLMWAQAQSIENDTENENVETSDQEASIELQPAENTTNKDLIQTQNQLAYIEGLVDAYDDSIGELSLEIGTLLASEGKTEEALSAFRRALHVSRINNGLDSDLQLPVLEAILDLQTKTNQISSAGDTLNRIYRIHQANYLSTDPATIDALIRIGIWHFSAYFFKIDGLSLTHLIKARRAFGLAHDFSQDSEQGYNFDLYNLLAMTDHGLASIASSNESSSNDTSSFSGNGQVTVSLVTGSYRRGKLLLETGILDARKSENIDSLVRAILLYADWNQMFNKRNAARKLYIRAYETALKLPEESPLRQSFNHPHRLPDFNSTLLQFGPKDVEVEMVPVRFNVDKWGASTNIEILPKENEEKVANSVRRAARSTIRTVAYRPSIVNGQPIDSVGVTQTVIVEL